MAKSKKRTGTRLLPWQKVQDRVGFSRTTAWRKDDFPRPVRISAGRVAWIEEEVDEWVEKIIRTARQLSDGEERVALRLSDARKIAREPPTPEQVASSALKGKTMPVYSKKLPLQKNADGIDLEQRSEPIGKNLSV